MTTDFSRLSRAQTWSGQDAVDSRSQWRRLVNCQQRRVTVGQTESYLHHSETHHAATSLSQCPICTHSPTHRHTTQQWAFLCVQYVHTAVHTQTSRSNEPFSVSIKKINQKVNLYSASSITSIIVFKTIEEWSSCRCRRHNCRTSERCRKANQRSFA